MNSPKAKEEDLFLSCPVEIHWNETNQGSERLLQTCKKMKKMEENQTKENPIYSRNDKINIVRMTR